MLFFSWFIPKHAYYVPSAAFEDMIAVALLWNSKFNSMRIELNEMNADVRVCVQNSRRKRKILLTPREVQTKREINEKVQEIVGDFAV